MQNVLASLASHVTTPLSSSGRPSLFNGFESAAISRRRGFGSKYAAVMLPDAIEIQECPDPEGELTSCICGQD